MRVLALLLLAAPAFAADIYHISCHGQSLALGTSGLPALSTADPGYGNKLLNYPGTSLGSLVESGVESPFAGMANQLFSMGGLRTLTEARIVGTDVTLAHDDCVGGAYYTSLAKGTNPYSQWLTVMQAAGATAAAAGLTYHYGGFMVTHGEQDIALGTTAATYAGYLLTWHDNLQADVQAAYPGTGVIPMLVSQVSNWVVWHNPGPGLAGSQPLLCQFSPCNGTQGRAVPLGQLDAARNNPGVIYFLGPKYQYTYTSDHTHLVNTAYRQLGELEGKAWKAILVDHTYWTGLVPRSITISGATVTLRLWVPAGSLAIDTTTLSDATDCQGYANSDGGVCTANGGFWRTKGFEWWDGSGAARPYITGVMVSSSDTLTLTLSATPTGSNQRVRYAFTGTGYYDTAPSLAPHGNIRDTDTAVGVSSGAHLYDWLATFDDPVGFSWATPPKRVGLFPLPGGFKR